MGRIYVVNHNVVVATAITIIQIKAGANKPLKIIEASISQSTVTTSAQMLAALIRKTAAATVTSFTPLKLSPNDPVADAVGGAAATGITATAEGTDGGILHRKASNILNEWLYLPVPEQRILVPAAGIIALKFLSTPTSATYAAHIIFEEQD